MKNNKLFESVLKANREYTAMLNDESTAEAQEKALAKCREVFELVIKANLCNEYSDYCNMKIATTGKLF